jgi:hypothetical protein
LRRHSQQQQQQAAATTTGDVTTTTAAAMVLALPQGISFGALPRSLGSRGMTAPP